MRSLLRPGATLLALMLAAAPIAAQPAAGDFDPRTGDAWVDTWLDDINRYGSAYRDPFVDEIARYHKAPRDLVLDLLGRPGWTAGDVYFACALAAEVGRPCRYVADEYERERGAGWGALAQRLGIAPGSPAFHRLKRGFVPTYERWARPIQLDDDLRRAFPGRARPAEPRDRPEPAGAPAADAPPARGGSNRGPVGAGHPDVPGTHAAGRAASHAPSDRPESSSGPKKGGRARTERAGHKSARPDKDRRPDKD